MILVPLTRGFVALIDEEDAHLAEAKWYASASEYGLVYATRKVRLEAGGWCGLKLHREVLRLHHGDGQIVDHLNGDTLDCRRANLRVVTNQENQRNRGGARADGSSGFLGVSRDGSGWWATIKVNGKRKYLGTFPTPEAANVARLRAELEIWGIQPRRREAFRLAGISA